MLQYGPPEHVFVENEWYDSPRVGIANVNGLLHRYVLQWDEHGDEYLGTFLVWPVRFATRSFPLSKSNGEYLSVGMTNTKPEQRASTLTLEIQAREEKLGSDSNFVSHGLGEFVHLAACRLGVRWMLKKQEIYAPVDIHR